MENLASAVYNDKLLVLILIIMEDTHGESGHISP